MDLVAFNPQRYEMENTSQFKSLPAQFDFKMAGREEVLNSTVEVFSQFPYDLLDDDWVKNQWENGFLEMPLDKSFEVSGDDINDLLNEAGNICRWWAEHSESLTVENGERSTVDAPDLWSTLLENNVEWKKLLALLCLTILKSTRRHSKISEKITGLYSSRLYFNLLNVPGSRAFRVYHPSIFQLALSGMCLPKVSSHHRKRCGKKGKADNLAKRSRINGNVGERKKKGRCRNRAASDVSESYESDDGGSDVQSIESENGYDAEDFDEFVKHLHIVMNDFFSLLQRFSLKKEKNLIEQMMQMLAEFVKLEIDTPVIPFGQMPEHGHNRRVTDFSYDVVLLAYNSLIILCDTLHGNETENSADVFKHIMPIILMSDASGCQTISRHFQVRKEHATAFVCYIIKKFEEKALKGARILLQQLCVQVLDKADFRAKVAQAVITILHCFPTLHYAEMVKWFYKLIRHARVNYRTCALDVFSHILSEPERELSGDVPNYVKAVLSRSNFIWAVLKRCSDKSPAVRTKALTIVATHAEAVLKLMTSAGPLQETNQSDSDHEYCRRQFMSDNEECLEQVMNNSDHEYCQKEPINNNKHRQLDSEIIMEMLLRRTNDIKVNVRKTAIQVLERILCLRKISDTEKYLKTLQEHCRDPAVLVRKQSLHSLTAVFEAHKNSAIIQQHWMKGVLSQLFDPEASIQEKCLDMIDCIIFQSLLGNEENAQVAWKILDSVACGKEDFQRYLQKAVHLLIKSGKIKGNMINTLISEVGGPNDAAVWLLLVQLAAYTDFRKTDFVMKYWEECAGKKKVVTLTTLKRILQVIGYLSNCIPKENLEKLKGELELQLKQFLCPPELISPSVETLCKIYQVLSTHNSEAQQKIKAFGKELLKDCDTYLSSIILEKNLEIDPNTECEMIKRLFTLGELAQLSPASVPSRAFLLIQSVVASPVITSSAPEAYGSQDTQSAQIGCTPLSQFNDSKMPLKVRAHAFIALGKLCLQNEDFAKKSIAALAKELAVSNDPTIRNNIVIIMADLNVRYTLLVDPYISTITACLKDPSQFVRKQTLILLTQLLQEDYIKWKGTLFFRMCIALIDEDNEIQNFVKFSLGHLLLRRHPHMFFQNFVESVFYFNCYTGHSSYNNFVQSAHETKLFALKGPENREKRMMLYKFMLENMNDEEKFKLNLKLCQDILGAVPDVISLNQESVGLVQDALSILTCDEIKLASLTMSVQDEVEDGDVAAAIVATAKKTIISQMVKKNVIENIVPIVVALKHILERIKSPLLKDLMLFLRELLKDYKSELKEIMAADKQLAKEIEFDLRRFDQQQQEGERLELADQSIHLVEGNGNVQASSENCAQNEGNNNSKYSLCEQQGTNQVDIISTNPATNSSSLANKVTTSHVNNQLKDKESSRRVCTPSTHHDRESILNSINAMKKLVEQAAKRRSITNTSSASNTNRTCNTPRQNASVVLLHHTDSREKLLTPQTQHVHLIQDSTHPTPSSSNRNVMMPKNLFRAISTPSGIINNITFKTQEDISIICSSASENKLPETDNTCEPKLILHLQSPIYSTQQRMWKLKKQ